MARRIISSLTALTVLSSLSLSVSADHTWYNYHWARNNSPMTLMVIDSVTDSWWGELDQSLAKWSASSVLDLQITQTDNSVNTRSLCAVERGKIHVCNASYGTNGWLGLATIGVDANGHIDAGAAMMNDTYASSWTPSLMNHVMCQEIGHLFGLGHTSTDGSSQQTCMDYSRSLDSQWPNQHDYDFLAQVYAHLDSYDSYNNTLDGGVIAVPPPPTTDPTSEPPPTTKPGKGGKGVKGTQRLKQDIDGSSNNNRSDQAKNDWESNPPMGIRFKKNKNQELWASPRRDGGFWVHHVRLLPGLGEDGHEHEDGVVHDDGVVPDETHDDGHTH